jgi:hypothetical protein
LVSPIGMRQHVVMQIANRVQVAAHCLARGMEPS